MNGIRAGKRGMSLYARLCAAVIEKPSTARELALQLGISQLCTVRVMRTMHSRYRIVHVSAWKQEVPHGCPNEVWGFGDAPDAKQPLTQKGKLSKRRPPALQPFSSECHAFASIMSALREGSDVRSMEELTGVWASTLWPFMAQLRRLKLIHTSDWIRNCSGSPTPILKLGERFNAHKLNADRPRKSVDDPAIRRARYVPASVRLAQSVAMFSQPSS